MEYPGRNIREMGISELAVEIKLPVTCCGSSHDRSGQQSGQLPDRSGFLVVELELDPSPAAARHIVNEAAT